MRILILLCLLIGFGWSQDYYEASGQTRVFTLMAGAKAGPSPVLPIKRLVPAAGPHLLAISNGLRIGISGLHGRAMLSVYNLSGKLIQSAEINGEVSVALRHDLPAGIYFARLEKSGFALQTIRFGKVR